ncbi:response regulator [Chloroflexota bacterium]
MQNEQPIRVLLVDDHQMVRQGLLFFLSTQPGITVLGEAATGEEALQLVEELAPDVVLLDLVLPGISGIEVMQTLRRQHPAVEVIVLTSFIDDSKVADAIRAGAAGYLMKDVDPTELAAAIYAIRSGELYLHPEAARRLAEAMRPGPGEQQEPVPSTLTERELEVLKLVARGMSNQEIAGQLNISLKTVKAHVSNILHKLALESRVQAALYALRHQVVQLDDL